MSDKQSTLGNLIARWGRLKTFMMTTTFLLLVGGFVAGIIFWGGFNTALEMTNREEFCISCHEMKDNVYAEYKNTIHYQNRTGVRATCPDCHVPKDWAPRWFEKFKPAMKCCTKYWDPSTPLKNSKPNAMNSLSTSGIA